MRCSACGEENLPNNLFCSKCATSLAKEQARSNRNARIYLPPQTELEKARSRSKPKGQGGWALVGILFIAIALAIFIYG